VLLVLKKRNSNKQTKKIKFLNYEKTYGFLQSGVENYRKLINENKISFSPFSSLPDSVSRFYQDHSEFFSDQRVQSQNDRTIFHTDYFWLGNGKRRVEIKLKIGEASSIETNIIQLRIHSYSTYASDNLKCVYEKEITVSDEMEINEFVDLRTDENSNYAFLCNLVSGNISCSSISIESLGIKEKGKNSIIKEQPEAVGVK
jgi:hypothetical protein